MAAVILARHASHNLIDRVLCGRTSDAGINGTGRGEARRIAHLLSGRGVTAIQSSPRRRAQETALILAQHLHLSVGTVDALDEVDFGSWSGRTFSELALDERWREWNEARDRAVTPGGETMLDVFGRAMAHVEAVSRPPAGVVLMISHAEVIRALILGATRRSFNDWKSVEVAPASLVRLEGAGWQIHASGCETTCIRPA